MKKNIQIALLLVVCAFAMFSQTKPKPPSIKRQIHLLKEEAKNALNAEEYGSAWKAYRKLILLDPNNEITAINAAIAMFKLHYSVDSAFVLGTTLSVSKLIDAKYYLAKIKHKQRLFDEAIALLEEYKKVDQRKRLHNNVEADYMIAACYNAKLFTSQPHRAVIKNMGAEVNSVEADYVPVIMPDESALYFTSKRHGSTGGKKNGDGTNYEDIYVSRKENGEWQKAKNVGAPINTDNNDACVAISPDGHHMIIYRSTDEKASGDLYISDLTLNDKWTTPRLMDNAVNSQYVETSVCFSNDTAEIYFSSNRPGGFGGKDLYRIKKLPDGRWSMPYNLGPNINTPYDEDAPFLYLDGVTLYFSSKGHNTMGDYDVFRSVLDKETNQFSKAENLGYPINDVYDDIFFMLSVGGQHGYYSSVKQETYGSSDIYQIDTRFGDNDLKVKNGVVMSTYDVPMQAKITLLDAEDYTEAGQYFSNAATGKFILVMNPLKSYRVIIETAGYETQDMNIAPIVSERREQILDIKLKKKKTAQSAK